LIALAVAIVVALSFILPGVLRAKPTAGTQQAAAGTGQGTGIPAGSAVPAFAGRNLLTGKAITSASVYGRRTLLFFSEGVQCQACLQQIRGLQQLGGTLRQRGIQLVAVTTDPPGELSQAARQYQITTPLISDANGRISAAFNAIGQGMMATTPGHAFALIYHGKVLWYRDYWLAPYRTMYVQPQKLLADIPRAPR
jgi:peroxiredoxin Q/BCP